MAIFDDSRASLAHAVYRVQELRRLMLDYQASSPFALIREQVAGHGGAVQAIKARLVKTVPAPARHTAFDAISHFRACLDQAAYACAAARRPACKRLYAKFPFNDSAESVQKCRHTASKDVPAAVFDVMAGFSPHKDGDRVLWGLNQLCNMQKHQMVLPSAVWVGSNVLNHARFDQVIEFVFPPRWDATRNEMVLATIPTGSRFDLDLELQVRIVFGEVPAFAHADVVEALDLMTERVTIILDAVEQVAGQIGLA